VASLVTPHQRRDVARLAPGLDVDDRSIEQRGDRLERNLSRARERLGLRHVCGTGEVPEEVASARCALQKHRGRRALHAVEHADDRRLERAATGAEQQVALQVAKDRRPEVRELDEEQLQAKSVAKGRDQVLRIATLALQRLPEKRKTGRGERLLTRDRARRLVVAAAVGHPATEHVAALVEQHGLGGRRAEVDADHAPHDRPCFRASSICR